MIDPIPSYNPTPGRLRVSRISRRERAALKSQAQDVLSGWMASPEGLQRREAALVAAGAVLSAMTAPRPVRRVF